MSSGSQRPPAPLFTAACCAVAGILLADQTASLSELYLVLPLAAPGRLSWLALLLLGAGTAHHWQRERSPARELFRRLAPGETRSALLSGTVADVPQPSGKPGTQPRWQFRFRVKTAEPGAFFLPGAGLLVHVSGAPPHCGEQVRLNAEALR